MLPPLRSARRAAVVLLLAVGAALVLAACGSSPDAGRPDEAASLLLDAPPNAAHTGIYLAIARGFDEAEGVRLSVDVPTARTDAAASLLSGQARFAVLDLHDLALARAQGKDLVAVMAIVQRPLAAVVARQDIARPRDLEGHTVGLGGRPGDAAVLRAIVRADGGDPAKVKRTSVGFGAVPALLGGKVAAASGFWTQEGVALQAAGRGARIFRIDSAGGAPVYPELVLVTTRATTQDSPAVVRATVTALQRGYRSAISDPDSAVSELQAAVPGLDRVLVGKQLDAVSPSFQALTGQVGTFDLTALRVWAAWEAKAGIVKQAPEVADMFTPRFAAEGAAKATEDSG